MEARRLRMRSGNGLCSIEDSLVEATSSCGTKASELSGNTSNVLMKPPRQSIAIDLTGELTPHGSECGDASSASRSSSIAELTPTWTLSALQRLSVEEQTTLGRKLGGSGPLAHRNKAGTGAIVKSPAAASSGDSYEWAKADSPFRVVLQNAVVQGDLEAAAAALESGADPNERDELRHSSLHFAAAKGDVLCLRKLMGSGARANVANNVGWSPLHYAVLGGHVDVVEALLRAGAHPCFRDNHLISPLHLASTQTGSEAGKRETFQQIARLLGPTALEARDELQQTPLHVAASCGNRDAVAVLLELNADPKAEDRKGRNPGQSWLKQVSKRARADIARALEAAVDRRKRAAAAAEAAERYGDDDFDGLDDDDTDDARSFSSCSDSPGSVSLSRSGSSFRRSGLEKQSSVSSSVCSDATPVHRPSMLNLLPSGWGLSRRGSGGGRHLGEMSFGADVRGSGI